MFFFENRQFDDNKAFTTYTSENLNFPFHIHNSFEFVHIYSGTLLLNIDNTPYEFNAGQSALLFPNQIHMYQTTEASKIQLLFFSTDIISDFFEKYKNMLPDCPIFVLSKLSEKDFDFEDVFLLKAFLYKMISCLCKSTSFSLRSQRNDTLSLLAKVLNYINLHYGEPCSLYVLAEELGYDYSYISRYIKKELGMPYNTYLNKYRILKSCSILADNQTTILNIAKMCGYSTIRSYNRNFKKVVGISPKEFKALL